MNQELQAKYNDCTGDGEGFTQDEARQALTENGQNPTTIGIKAFWKKKEKGEQDKITVKELCELNDSFGDPVKNLRAALKVFDEDNNNYISRKELLDILKHTDTECQLWKDSSYVEDTIDFILNSSKKEGESVEEIKKREEGFIEIDALVDYLLASGDDNALLHAVS